MNQAQGRRTGLKKDQCTVYLFESRNILLTIKSYEILRWSFTSTTKSEFDCQLQAWEIHSQYMRLFIT